MTDDIMMRLRLQTVAAYRELCRYVQRGGRDNVLFALLMMGLAYYSFRPNAGGIVAVIYILYICLALAELAVGLFKAIYPTAEGVLLDALILLLFAGWNLGWQGLMMAVNITPNPIIVFLGLYMLFAAFGRFKSYMVLRRMFAERPAPEHIAWFDDLVMEIRTSDPEADQLVLDLPTRPHWKAKLLGSTAFFVAMSGHSVYVTGPGDFTIVREKTDHGTGSRKAMLSIYGLDYPEFNISDASWKNYTRWLAEQGTEPPANS